MKIFSKACATATLLVATFAMTGCASGQSITEACALVPADILAADQTLEDNTQNIATMNEDREAFLAEVQTVASNVENADVKEQLNLIIMNLEKIGEVGNANVDPKDALKAFDELEEAKEQLAYNTADLANMCN